MMEFFLFLLMGSFVNYRIARMIAMEDGAFYIFIRFRIWIGRKFKGKDETQHWIESGMNCPLCIGFWTALLVSSLLFQTINIWQWLAIAGISAFLQRMERE